ncbi:MAG: hypothetical protein RLZZ436_3629 [Planctomycetota bacterium]|jgi:hypothetical protein
MAACFVDIQGRVCVWCLVTIGLTEEVRDLMAFGAWFCHALWCFLFCRSMVAATNSPSSFHVAAGVPRFSFAVWQRI